MLRYLTHKLRTQSLNEERNFEGKAQEDHDSGTESDDESGDTNDLPGDQHTMEHDENCEWGGSIGNRSGGAMMFPLNNSMVNNNGGGGSRPRSRSSYGGEDSGSDMMMVLGGSGGRDSASSQFEAFYPDSALPSDSDHAYDHHSSEEELEVINNSYQNLGDCQNEEALLGDDEVRGPGSENKRKWSQVASNRLSVESTSSSDIDDEVQGLLRPLSTPVEFCTSPPLTAHKPSRSQSPPPKLFLFASNSPPGSISGSDQGNGSTIVGSGGPLCLMNGHTGGVFRGLRPRTSDPNNTSASVATLGAAQHNASSNALSSQNHGLMNGSNCNQTHALLGEGQQDGRSAHNNRHHHETPTTAAANGRTSRGGRDSTSRKRHRHHNPRHIQRPWLDFEKMQQLKARSVTTWRSSGGELSLYCS